ncbi:MAG TPA: hypothetical protein PK788_01145 [Gemmatimonadaceae bacterium]|nr:hypothetical protein [Gemmatimonadaceae bacterium]HRQ77174.1 hypothetical protein [Gemmatimonadaceae bacterium]
MAFTLGFDAGDRLVTILSVTGRLMARAGARGAGPGEFNSVLSVVFVGDSLYLGGAGQVSAFTLQGRHLWSRAVPPLQLMVGAHADSLDMLDARFWADGRGVGSAYRRSTRRGGGERRLFDGDDPTIRAFAKGVQDSTRFPRPGFASARTGFVLAHPQTGALLYADADGRRPRLVQPARAPRFRSSDDVTRELRDAERASQRPFRLPDGRFVTLPFDRQATRRRLEAPIPYFSARLGGLHFDARSGRVLMVESLGDSAQVTAYALDGGSIARGRVACDNRDGSAAVALPFVLLACAAEDDGERVPVLKLFRVR